MQKIKQKKTQVSFLILNYNGKNLLKIILDSINKLNFKGNFEIIIVDNNSTDGSQEFLRNNYPYVKIVQNKENLGTSGINSGLPSCRGDYIFYLNNDIELEKNSLKILYGVIQKDTSIGIVAPKHVNYYNRKLKSGGYWISRSFYAGHHKAETSEKTREVPYAGVFLFRKEIIDKLGYFFDPDYFIYSEDIDFCLRSRLLDYKVVFAPASIIYHMHAATIGKEENYKLTFFIERNTISTFIKIVSLKSIILLFPYVALMRVLAIIRDISRFQFRNAFARIKAVFWIIFHFGILYKKRFKLQKLRKIKDKELLRFFSEKYLLKPMVPV